MNKIDVLIVGSTGYIGLELLKLLTNHKYINIKYLCGNSSIGKKISYFDKRFKNKKLPKIIKFNKKLLKYVDIVFTALPYGGSQKISKYLLKRNKLIDLSADFRLTNKYDYIKWYKKKHIKPEYLKKSIYSLPELTNRNLKNYKIIACPGCYPTSILIPLIPLIKNKLIKYKNIIIDSKSGYSGAGRNVHEKYKNDNLYESIKPYGITIHRHNSEIQQELNIAGKKNVQFTFTPHLTPMFRGILSSIYVELEKKSSINKILSCLKKTYQNRYFIKIMKPNVALSTNSVINTNYCNVSVNKTKHKDKIIIFSVIDNLIKGGSGQAIQNLNLLKNFDVKEGLI